MGKTVLITGASGFIGRSLINEALLRKYDVYAMVRESSKVDHLAGKPIHLISVDLSDCSSIAQILSELPPFDYIIHAAGVTKSFISETYYKVNVQYTQNLVDAIVQSKKIPEVLMYFSSLAAFGPGNADSSIPVKNDDIPKPITNYGVSKLKAEEFVRNQTQIPYIILRPTAVYGPGERDIFQSIKLMKYRFDFNIGFHKQYLTFVYVQDLVNVTYDLLESKNRNKAYFVSDGAIYTKKDLGNYVEKKLNKKVFHIPVPLCMVRIIAFLTETIAKVTKKAATALNYEKVKELAAINWNCDIDPLTLDIGYKAMYNLECGVNQTIDWYKKEDWL